jgi:hypothetical protein
VSSVITDAFLASYAKVTADGQLDVTGAVGREYVPVADGSDDTSVKTYLVVFTTCETQTDVQVPITVTVMVDELNGVVHRPLSRGTLPESRFFVLPLHFKVRPVPVDVLISVTVGASSLVLPLRVLRPVEASRVGTVGGGSGGNRPGINMTVSGGQGGVGGWFGHDGQPGSAYGPGGRGGGTTP